MFYWVRRLLKFSRKQWLKLPWYEQDMYLKGMIAEMQARASAPGGGGAAGPAASSSQTYDLSGGGSEATAGYQALGINVERI